MKRRLTCHPHRNVCGVATGLSGCQTFGRCIHRLRAIWLHRRYGYQGLQVSAITRAKGAMARKATVKSPKRTTYGFVRDHLQALYLFEDGAEGQTLSGHVRDYSGNALHGKLREGWARPTVRSFGIEGADGGIVVDTPLKFEQCGSIVLSAQLPTYEPQGSRYPWLIGHSEDAPLTPLTAAVGRNSGRAFVNTLIDKSNPGHGGFGIFRSGGTPGPSNPSRSSLEGTGSVIFTPWVLGIRWDSTSGYYELVTGDMRAYRETSCEHFSLGASITFGVANWVADIAPGEIPAGAQIFGAAFYSDSSALTLATAMRAMAKRVSGRGVVFG